MPQRARTFQVNYCLKVHNAHQKLLSLIIHKTLRFHPFLTIVIYGGGGGGEGDETKNCPRQVLFYLCLMFNGMINSVLCVGIPIMWNRLSADIFYKFQSGC